MNTAVFFVLLWLAFFQFIGIVCGFMCPYAAAKNGHSRAAACIGFGLIEAFVVGFSKMQFVVSAPEWHYAVLPMVSFIVGVFAARRLLRRRKQNVD